MAIPMFLKKGNKEINRVVLLPVEEIASNPSQPRHYFDPAGLEELCSSIATSGLLTPISVRKLPSGKYELIAGERRLLAFRKLERTHIPAIVEEYTDQQSAVFALVENLQRRDLNYFEEAVGIARLMEEQGLSQVQVSQRLGKAQSTVANKLRLLKYSPEIREKLLFYNLTERHARALLKLPDPGDPVHIEYIAANKLNVEQTEEYVDSLLKKGLEKPLPTRLFIIKDMRIFLNSINKAVKMMQSAGIDVDTKKTETDEFIELTMRVPKSSVYKPKKEKQSV